MYQALNIPKWIQDGSAGLFASDRLELEQGRLRHLLEGRVESADRYDETGSFLFAPDVRPDVDSREHSAPNRTYHSRAGKDVPAEPHAIAILNLAPLFFERFVVHARQSREEGSREFFAEDDSALGCEKEKDCLGGCGCLRGQRSGRVPRTSQYVVDQRGRHRWIRRCQKGWRGLGS